MSAKSGEVPHAWTPQRDAAPFNSNVIREGIVSSGIGVER